MNKRVLAVTVGAVLVAGVAIGGVAALSFTGESGATEKRAAASEPQGRPRARATTRPGALAPSSEPGRGTVAALPREQDPAAARVEGTGAHGGPGTADLAADERRLAANAERARALIERGAAGVLAALRGTDRELARAVYDALLDDAVSLCDRELLAGLASCASDALARREDRALALELLGHSAGTDAELLHRIAGLAVSDPDATTRAAALGAVRQLAVDRVDLAGPTRAALTEAAESTTSSELRGDALSSIHTEHASAAELERIAKFLADPDATVRVATAIALAGADPEQRGAVASSIEAAFQRETDGDSASALAGAALRVGRGDAGALFDRMARAEIVRTNATLARQIQDYRSLIADGEVDPVRIERIHQQREDARVAGGVAR